MKKLRLTKFASLLAVLMVLSVLVPLVAAAAPYFEDLKFKDGKITGKYHTDNPLETGDPIDIDILNNLGVPFDVAEAVYTSSFTESDGVSDIVYRTYNIHHDFGFSVSDNVYQAVYLQYDGTISEAVYRETSSRNRGGGGGIFFPGIGGSIEDGVINVGTSGRVSASELERAFENNSHVTIHVGGDVANIPAQALVDAANNVENATITVVTDNGTYSLPLSVLDFDQLASELDVDLDDMTIRVEIKRVTGSTATAIQNRIEQLGGEQVSEAVDFAVIAVGNDSTYEINSFGDTYVERSIPLHHSVDTDKTTGVVYDPDQDELYFVPSVFVEDDDAASVILKRNSNSIYTTISLEKSFNDVPAGHWADEDIHVLANKLVVHGVSDNVFDLDRSITRAEFAALVVRSLGLRDAAGSHNFSDVPAGAWYAEEVGIATVSGLVYGYEDGTFRPDNVITREELAALVVRAAEYAGVDVSVTDAEQNQLLSSFRDADQIGWGHEELAQAIKAEIVHGMGNDILDPKGTATRAQATAMLYRYLQGADFID